MLHSSLLLSKHFIQIQNQWIFKVKNLVRNHPGFIYTAQVNPEPGEQEPPTEEFSFPDEEKTENNFSGAGELQIGQVRFFVSAPILCNISNWCLHFLHRYS